MTQQTRLPYRPRPNQDESFPGYALRLAHWYGYANFSGFSRRVLGVASTDTVSLNSQSGHLLTRRLEQALGMDARELRKIWSTQFEGHDCYSASRVIEDITISSPRLCPHCLVETGYMRFDWQVAHVLTCSKHRGVLLDHCPSCHQEFRWQTSLLSGCECCGHSWKVCRLQEKDDNSDADTLVDLVDKDRLYLAYLHLLNPKAPDTWELNRFPYVPSCHQKLMSAAYRLVTDETFNEAFSLQIARSDLPALGRNIRVYRTNSVRKLLQFQTINHSFTDSSVLVTEESLGRIALPPRIKKLVIGDLKACDIAPPNVAAQLLGISVHELNRLVDEGLVEAVVDSRIQRNRVFSLTCLDQFLAAISRKTDESVFSDPIGLDTALKMLSRFGFTLTDLVHWCNGKELHFSTGIGTENGLRQLNFDRLSLLNLCEAEFSADAKESYSRAEVLEMLFITEDCLDEISRRGYLSSKKWQLPGAEYESSEVQSFLSRYRIARREASLSGTDIHTVWGSILRSGAVPVLDRLKGGHLIGIAVKDVTNYEEAA